jgi:ABC-type transport system substrate-binding protein
VLEQAATNDPSTTANGTGPYTVASWTQGDNLRLERADGYWGTPASVEAVVFRYVTDPSAAINATLSGDLAVGSWQTTARRITDQELEISGAELASAPKFAQDYYHIHEPAQHFPPLLA